MQDRSQGTSVLDEITRLLEGTAVPGTFATRRVADAVDLHLDVKGIGPVPIPVPATVARRLCDVARPARYGLRDQTLLDERVRAGREIGKRQIKIDARRWRRTLDRQQTWARDLAWLRRVARSFASRSSGPVGAVHGGRNAQMEAP